MNLDDLRYDIVALKAEMNRLESASRKTMMILEQYQAMQDKLPRSWVEFGWSHSGENWWLKMGSLALRI